MFQTLSKDFFDGTKWTFSNQENQVFSEIFTLNPDGKIVGYNHPNENTWTFESDRLKVFREDGELSCVFERIDDIGDQYFVFCGLFEGSATEVRHILRRRKPTVGCFFRTHFWNDNVSEVCKTLENAWGSNIFICADQTRPFETDNVRDCNFHSVDLCIRHGLISWPSKYQTMWYNGDYAIYEIILNTDFDFIIVSEYDLLINTDLRPIAEKVILGKYDFVASRLGEPNPAWGWTDIQRKWDEFENVNLDISDINRLQLFSCLFSFIVISRPAALFLFSRRIDMGLRHARNAGKYWPFCESFVPSELVRNGFKVCDLSSMVGGEMHMTTDDPFSLKLARESRYQFIHPVFQDEALIAKFLEIARNRYKYDGIEMRETLEYFRPRCGTKREFEMLDQEIERIAE